jgi:hypothetical protein
MKHIKTFLILMFALTCITSCKLIPLYDPTTNVYLRLDLKLNTDIILSEDVDIEGNPALRDKDHGIVPQTVRACFYDYETHKLIAEDFLPPEGGFVNVPAGLYDIIVYSLDSEITRTGSTDSRGEAHAYTNETGATVRIYTKGEADTKAISDYKVIYEPDHIFVGTKDCTEIPVQAVHDDITVIDIEMTTILETYSLEVKHIEGAGRIQKADIYITGQAQSKFMWDRRYRSNPCAIYFQSEMNPEKGHLFTVFNTFGKYPNAHNDVYINVLVTDISGGKYQWIYDVTDQFDDPDNNTHEIIIEDRIIIPEGGDGFTHEVNDWDSEIIYVPL